MKTTHKHLVFMYVRACIEPGSWTTEELQALVRQAAMSGHLEAGESPHSDTEAFPTTVIEWGEGLCLNVTFQSMFVRAAVLQASASP